MAGIDESKVVNLKILIIGDSGVGKTCQLVRYCENKFSDSLMTTCGVDFMVSRSVVDGQSVKLQIWDTAGQEKFDGIRAAYYRGAHGILLTYSCDSRPSFDHVLDRWMPETIKNFAGERPVVFITASKADLPEDQCAVAHSEGQRLAEELGLEFRSTSAKTGDGVREAFESLVKKILASPELVGDQVGNTNGAMSLTSQQEPRKKCSC